MVEQPAIGLFAEYSAGPNPHPQPFSHWEKGGGQAGLRVRSLVLVSRLRAALERLNPALPRLLLGQVSLSEAREVISLSPHKNKS